MSGIEYLVDTNIVIYFLQRSLPIDAHEWVKRCLEQSAVSVITRIESLAWPSAIPADTLKAELFFDELVELGLNKSVASTTIAVRRQHRLKLPDAIIAATALHHNLTLVTHNVRDFARVEGLRVYDPMA